MEQAVHNLVQFSRPSLKGSKEARHSQVKSAAFKNVLSVELEERLEGLAAILKLSPAVARKELGKMDLNKLKQLQKLVDRLLKKGHLSKETVLSLEDLKNLLQEVLATRKGEHLPKFRETAASSFETQPHAVQQTVGIENSNIAAAASNQEETAAKTIPPIPDNVPSRVQSSREGPAAVIKKQEINAGADNDRHIILKNPAEEKQPLPIRSGENATNLKVEQEGMVKRGNFLGEIIKEDSVPDKKPFLKPDSLTVAGGKFIAPDAVSKPQELIKISYPGKVEPAASLLEPDIPKPESRFAAIDLNSELNKIGAAERDVEVPVVREKHTLPVTDLNFHFRGKADYFPPLSGKELPTYRTNLQGLVEQLSRAVRIYTGSNHQQIRLQLEPEELGKIKLDLKVKEGEVLASLKVENQGVKEYLEQNLTGLKNNLARQGLNLEQFEIHVDDWFEPESREDMRDNRHFNQQQGQNGQNRQSEFSLDGEEFLQELQVLEDDQSVGYYWMMLNYSYHRMNLLA